MSELAVTALLYSTGEQGRLAALLAMKGLALATFEPRVSFIDDVNAPFPLHDL